jgi:hypothetical protein
MHPDRPILLTGYTREIAPLAELCLPSKEAWARRWNCPLHVLRDVDFPQSEGHPSFQKMYWIRDRLGACGRPVIWLDADTLITNPDVDPHDLIPRESIACLAVSRDYDAGGRPEHLAWSAGVMAWVPTSKAVIWLTQAQMDEAAMWSGLWDQDALQRSQPIVGVEIRAPRAMNAVLPVLGGHSAGWRPGDLLIHFTGIPQHERLARAQEFLTGLARPEISRDSALMRDG